MTSEPLIAIDQEASTVTIADRRYPAVALICPVSDNPNATEEDRALGACGAAPNDRSVYIPTENGLLLRVEEGRNESRHGLSLDPCARTCERVQDPDGWLWLPRPVGWFGGVLLVGRSNVWYWAEPEWVVEMIDRLSVLPFEQPPGEPTQIVRLNHFRQVAA